MKIQVFRKNNEHRLIKVEIPRIRQRVIKQIIKKQSRVIRPQSINKKIYSQSVQRVVIQQVNKQIIRVSKKVTKDENYNKIELLKNCGVGRILVMIACGPSVLEVDFTKINKLSNVDIMVINKPLKSIWPSKYWAFCDQSQFVRNESDFNNYSGLLINSNVVMSRKNNQVIIKAKHGVGVTKSLHDGYVIGRSSVYANMQVAMWMNYDKIFIFGVDMCKVGDKLHYYGINPDVKFDKRLDKFSTEAANYVIMASKLPDNIRKKFYFCSSYNPWPFVNMFNKLDHKEAIDKILI